MNNSNTTQDLTVDIVIGGIGKAGEALSTVAQNALLEAFKAAGRLEDLAARLAIPIQLLTVTGAKVVAANGYDAYKITIAIRSDDPSAVAKEVFSTGVGLAAAGGTGLAMRFAAPFLGVAAPAVSFVAPIAVGAVASNYAGEVWDETLSKTPAGQWSIGEISSGFGIGLKITQNSLQSAGLNVPAQNQAPNSVLIYDPTDKTTKAVFSNTPVRTFSPDVVVDANTYTVKSGDSLWLIAKANGWDYKALLSANPQLADPNFINVGQKINGLGAANVGLLLGGEYQLNALHDSGILSDSYWNNFTSESASQLLGGGLTPGGGSYGLQPPANWLDPIGAFYDSQSAGFDNAASIANKTTRAMNANGQALTANQLAALDTNGDGQISTAEAAGTRLWADLNENGAIKATDKLIRPKHSANTPMWQEAA